MAVDCRQPKKERPTGGGKGRGVSSLEAAAGEEEEVTNAIGSTYALTIPPRDVAPLNACMPPAETWKGYVKVKVPVDSCASECVCGLDHFPAVEIDNNEDRPEYGREYSTADDGRIWNVGEKRVKSLTDEGDRMDVKWQVTQVKSPLLAVIKLVDAGFDVSFNKGGGCISAGFDVSFNKGGGCIRNTKTGTKTRIYRHNGVFAVSMWVPKTKGEGGFARQR